MHQQIVNELLEQEDGAFGGIKLYSDEISDDDDELSSEQHDD